MSMIANSKLKLAENREPSCARRSRGLVDVEVIVDETNADTVVIETVRMWRCGKSVMLS